MDYNNREQQQSNSKTRHISTYEFLEILQIEFIVAQLRRKIYPSKKDKAYYERVMAHKKAKIEDIYSRNKHIPTMFNNDKIKESLHLKVYGESGLPNFFYKDEATRFELEEKDFFNYFMSENNVEVKVLTGDGAKIGKLIELSVDHQTVRVQIKNETDSSIYPITQVSRIL